MVIDASIAVSAFLISEDTHPKAKKFLANIISTKQPVVVPEIFSLEIASAIARVKNDPERAEKFTNFVLALPQFTFISINREFILQARAIAIHNRIRALDSCYLAVARQYGLTLYTLDREQVKKAPSDVKVKLI